MMSRLLPVVLILAALGIFFGYINPTYSGAIASVRSEIAGYDSALQAAKNYEAKKEKLIEERNNIPQEGITKIEAFLPDGVDNVQLILDLNALAARSGLSLSNFDIIAGKSSEDAQRFALDPAATESLSLSMSATGTYAAFKKFIQGAELSLRPLDLVEVDVQDSETGVYTFQITFRIYWLAPN